MYNNYNGFYPFTGVGRGLGFNAYSGGYRPGLLSGIIGGFRSTNWSSLLNNTQKTLNVINQAIPVVNQVKPLWNNTKTMFKIMGAVKSEGKFDRYEAPKKEENQSISENDNKPRFFI